MSFYGKNFEWRIDPESEARQGRFVTPTTGNKLPIGIPVVADTAVAVDALGRQQVKVAAADTARGAGGNKGILLFEYGPAAYAGDDPELVTYSDKDVVPLGQSVQVIGGDPSAKCVLRNTSAHDFLGIRHYPGRVMVAGIGIATPTLKAGDFLIPGTGDDVAGWWKETSSEADAWLQIMFVDNTRAEVEARMLF